MTFDTYLANSQTYHCMSRLVLIRMGMCRCCCWLRDLRDMSGLRRKCISRQIWWLCHGHEWMRNDEEPVHVVRRTLTWHNTHLTCWRKIVWVVHPLVIYLIKWLPWIDRRCRNTLDVSELAHNPLCSESDSNGPPAELTGKAWNQVKLLDRSMLPIRHSTDIRNPESINMLPIRLCIYGLHSLLSSNPSTCTWWHLVVVQISDPQLTKSAHISNTTKVTWKSYKFQMNI